MLVPRALQSAGAPQTWTERAIHDTVARIAAEAKFASAPRESLLGRLFRYLWRKLLDPIGWFEGRADAKLYLYGAIAVVVIVIVARIVAEKQIADGRKQRSGARRTESSTSNAWAVANDAAARGSYVDACHALYAAVLTDLAQSGSIKLHASNTSGDYARELQRRGFAHLAEYQAFVRAFDRAVFGTADVSASDYDRIRDAALGVFQRRVAA